MELSWCATATQASHASFSDRCSGEGRRPAAQEMRARSDEEGDPVVWQACLATAPNVAAPQIRSFAAVQAVLASCMGSNDGAWPELGLGGGHRTCQIS